MKEKFKLSVIVPGYNVDEYLEECLDSLANQTLSGIQVILVDDGSPGKTPEIMDEYAARYENFEVIHQVNQGLGAARNNGVPYAKGEYIAFMDSDDRVPLDAYEKMYQTAVKTGSDMVIGAVDRFNSTKQMRSWLHKKAIHDTIYKTHITKNPELIYDTTAWNKLYKKSFWDKHNFSFPTGMLYEDIPVTIPAHFLAESVDVISDTIYHWRTREGNDKSITQSRNEYRNFADRVKALNMVDDFYKQNNVSEELCIAKDYKWLTVDYFIFVEDLPEADAEYLERFQADMAEELKKIHPKAFQQLPLLDRMKYQLIMDNQMDALISVSKLKKGNLMQKKPYLKQGRYFVDYPFKDMFPKDFFDVTDELPLVSKISGVTYEESQIFVKGHTYIQGIDSKRNSDVVLKANLVNISTGKRIAVDAELKKNSQITRKWGVRKKRALLPTARVYNYNFSEFLIHYNVEEALSHLGAGIWKIELDLEVKGIKRKAFLANPIKGSKKADSQIIDSFKFSPKYNSIWELTFGTEEIKHFIQDVVFEQDSVVIKGWRNQEINDTELILKRKNEEKHYTLNPLNDLEAIQSNFADKVQPYFVKIPIREFFEARENAYWRVIFRTSGINENSQAILNKRLTSYIFEEKEVIAEIDNTCCLGFHFHLHLHPRVNNVTWKSDDTLFLEIEYNKNYLLEINDIRSEDLVMVSRENGEEKRYQLTQKEDGTNQLFEVSIPFIDKYGDMHFVLGAWDFYLEIDGYYANKQKRLRSRIQVNDDVVIDAEPKINSNIRTTPYATDFGYLAISNKLAWGKLENDSRKQKVIKFIVYPLMRLLPIKKNTVIFESFWGRSYSCNPKAIYEYMQSIDADYKYIWFFDNENTHVDGNAEKVRKNSWKYWYYLARGQYFIENANFPNHYRKRTGQIEVQTLHGTFLKTMGLDETVTFNTTSKQNALLRRSGRWDYLVSPSEYMTKVSKGAFLFKNEMLEVGFPRNDVLYTKNNDEYINELKQKFQLPTDKKVILYAPTFRVRKGFKVELDLEEMYKKFGDEYIILMRLHYFVAKSLDLSEYAGFAYNMSSYPDIQDLYLISDIMITDYSSVMFDYGHLKRPMIFFAYDLELYRDHLRGMYLDYEEVIPGPIARTTGDVVEILSNIDDMESQYKDKLQTFYDTYCMYGRGDSSKAIYERVFLGETELQKGEPYLRNLLKRKLKVNKWYPALFRLMGKLPRRKTVVFESFFGRQYSCNPRAIYEYMKEHYPDYKLIWNVNKEYAHIFEEQNVPYMIRFSYKGLFTWATAKYWVTNSRLPLWLPKPEKTEYIQTWHGTPLKTLGVDVELVTMPGMTVKKYHESFTKESSKWDYCVAPNQYSSDIFKRAFDVKGEMINSGYPRNDILYSPDKQKITLATKEKLNIPSNKKVVLYAPTWRDNEYKKVDHYTFNIQLDLDRIRKEFGEDIIVLMRMHYLIAEKMDLSGYEGFVMDVSNYLDIRELYLISDVLITDYSSVFFDYANLKRPILFYAYDLDAYANEIRGFYFDFIEEAPGPIAQTTEELIPHLREALAYDGKEELYPDFYQKFCGWEDGSSSKRVVEEVLKSK